MNKKAGILIVDDDEAMRDSCSQVLKKSGYEVSLSPDGYDGLKKITELEPDLILLDLKMPGLSGMEVLEKIVRIEPDIIVIVITGFATIESAVEAIKKGAYDFLPKPFQPEDLRVIVKRGLDKRRLIIESNQLREEKKKLEKNFISLVSHQLRTPLSNIQQYFEVMLQGFAGELTPKQCEILEKQQKNVKDLLKLIEDWLSMARIDRETVQNRIQPVDIAEIFEHIREATSDDAAKENITVRIEELKDLPKIAAVQVLIEEAFKNLVNNAIKYNHPNGEVSVRGRVKDE